MGQGSAERVGNQDAEAAPDHREHGALRQELAYEARPSGTQRDAHGDLALTCRPSHEQQTGQVGARDEEDRAGGRGHHAQGPRECPAGRVDPPTAVVEGETRRVVVLRHSGRGDGLTHQRLGFDACAFRRRARLQPSHHAHPPTAGVLDGVGRVVERAVQHRGKHQVGRLTGRYASEAVRTDADDGDRRGVDVHRSPDDGAVTAERALPEGVAEDRDGLRGARAIVFGPKRSTEGRLDPEPAEEVAGDDLALGQFRTPAGADADPREPGEAEQVGKRRGMVPDVGEHRERERPRDALLCGVLSRASVVLAREPGAARRPFQLAQLVGSLDGQRLEQYSLDQAEDRRVHADGEGERRDGDGGEHRCPPHLPERITRVGA